MLNSVRVRLTLWYSAALAVVLLVVSATTYLIVSKTSMQRTDTDLATLADSFVTTFRAELADAGDTQDSSVLSAARQSMVEHRSENDAFAIVDQAGRIVANSNDAVSGNTAVNAPVARVFASADFQKFAGNFSPTAARFETVFHPRFRAYSRPLQAGNKSYMLVALRSLHAQFETMETIRLTFAWMSLAGLLLAGTGGYFLAQKSLAPVADMGTRARGITAANLHERLPVQGANDELGQLAKTFNDLLDRLEQSFERQKRFIADASHELRTPLAILRGEAEVALSQPGRNADEYIDSLRILHEETSRLIKIVEDLFTLSRADSGQYPILAQDVYLEEVVADCTHSLRSLAHEKNIELVVDANSECRVRGDQALLRRMILNLLDNAIKYTNDGGRVEVSCAANGHGFRVLVVDTGPGIPSELQSRIFERFFRADPARSRSGAAGGAGLGLSIALWIAQAHHGKLELLRSNAGGSQFAVFLPGAADALAATG